MITRDSVQQAALREALMFKRSGLQLATGAGKTKIGLDYINCLSKEAKVLVWESQVKTSHINQCQPMLLFQPLD